MKSIKTTSRGFFFGGGATAPDLTDQMQLLLIFEFPPLNVASGYQNVVQIKRSQGLSGGRLNRKERLRKNKESNQMIPVGLEPKKRGKGGFF